MAITDISISEELMTNAPSIKYRGNEGPKSPQEMQMMMVDDVLDEAYEQYIFDLLEQRPDATPMSKDEFRRMVIGEGLLGGGNPLPEDPTKPVNPFAPKPTGPTLPDKRQMAAFGGIMGLDGRRQYGIGSFFQNLKDKIVGAAKDNPELTAALVLGGADLSRGDESALRNIFKDFEIPQGVKDAGKAAKDFIFEKPTKVVDGKVVEGQSIAQQIGGSIAKNIVPIAGGITAGLFTKNQPEEQTGLPSDDTALQLAELKKSANLLDQKQGLAAGLNFLPAVAARQFTPEEMAITYAQSAPSQARVGIASGGRIGFKTGLLVPEDEMTEKTNQMILDMHKRGMDVDTISTVTEKDAAYVNSIISAQNKKAEGGLMDLGGLEKDYRAEGGFVPIGKREKADDVPARLSVNEFVFTADAVRNAGGGDVDQGAKVMERVMKHLEAGGQMSRESQGMGGARDMFAVSERLSEVV